MKTAKISRRSFLLGLAACSAAGVLTACKGTYKGFSEVIYNGQRLKIKGKKYHHNSTVIYL